MELWMNMRDWPDGGAYAAAVARHRQGGDSLKIVPVLATVK
jgi:hypothetical protein